MQSIRIPTHHPAQPGFRRRHYCGRQPRHAGGTFFYETPFEFSDIVHSVTFDVSGEVIEDKEAVMRQIMARQ